MPFVMKIKYLHIQERFWTGTPLTYKAINTSTKKNPQPSDSIWPKLHIRKKRNTKTTTDFLIADFVSPLLSH